MTDLVMPVLKSIKSRVLIDASLGFGHGMAMPLQSLEPGSVGARLAVPQTQREGMEYPDYPSRRQLADITASC